jgi:hypothetical protein
MAVQAIAKGGGSPVTIAKAVPAVFSNASAVDESYVYWTKDPGQGSYRSLDIERITTTAGGSLEKVATISGTVAALAVDPCNLYTVTPSGFGAQPTH